MRDWAKELYEAHVEHINKIDPANKDYIVSWDELTEKGKQVWNMTAQWMLRELH